VVVDGLENAFTEIVRQGSHESPPPEGHPQIGCQADVIRCSPYPVNGYDRRRSSRQVSPSHDTLSENTSHGLHGQLCLCYIAPTLYEFELQPPASSVSSARKHPLGLRHDRAWTAMTASR
jgi:hypothetical protein